MFLFLFIFWITTIGIYPFRRSSTRGRPRTSSAFRNYTGTSVFYYEGVSAAYHKHYVVPIFEIVFGYIYLTLLFSRHYVALLFMYYMPFTWSLMVREHTQSQYPSFQFLTQNQIPPFSQINCCCLPHWDAR